MALKILGIKELAYNLLDEERNSDLIVPELYGTYLKTAFRGICKLTGHLPEEVAPSADFREYIKEAIAGLEEIAREAGEPIASLDQITLYDIRISEGMLWKKKNYRTIVSTPYDLGLPNILYPADQANYNLIEGLPLLGSQHIEKIRQLVAAYDEKRAHSWIRKERKRLRDATERARGLTEELTPVFADLRRLAST